MTEPYDVLAHFGVKGMKWGIRRDRDLSTETKAQRQESAEALRSYLYDSFQRNPVYGSSMTKEKYDSLSTRGETFAKDMVLRRVARDQNSEIRGNLYVSTLLKDAQFYKAALPALGVNSKNRGSGLKEYKQKHYEIEMQSTKKLSSPSEKERVDAFIELLEEPAVHVKGRDLPITGREYLGTLGYTVDFKKYPTERLAFERWDIFTKMQGNQDNPLSKAYFEKIKSKGYNAIIDDYDRGRYTEKPLILLDPESTVRLKNVRQLTTDEINQAQRSLKNPGGSVSQSIVKFEMDDILTHYGIKGMKWGVRNDSDRSVSSESRALRKESRRKLDNFMWNAVADEPIFGKTMSKEDYKALSTKGETFVKNTTFRRVTPNSEAIVKGNVYVSTLMKDAEFYRGAMPAVGPNAKGYGGGRKEYKQKHYEIEMKATKKLSSPSEKERVDAFIELLEEPSIKMKGKKAPVTGRAYLERIGFKPLFRRYETEELARESWHGFVGMQGDQNNPLAQAYFEKIKSKGYNAIIDDNDRGRYVDKPVILLDPDSTVEVKGVRRLTTDEINQAQRNLQVPS